MPLDDGHTISSISFVSTESLKIRRDLNRFDCSSVFMMRYDAEILLYVRLRIKNLKSIYENEKKNCYMNNFVWRWNQVIGTSIFLLFGFPLIFGKNRSKSMIFEVNLSKTQTFYRSKIVANKFTIPILQYA